MCLASASVAAPRMPLGSLGDRLCRSQLRLPVLGAFQCSTFINAFLNQQMGWDVTQFGLGETRLGFDRFIVGTRDRCYDEILMLTGMEYPRNRRKADDS